MLISLLVLNKYFGLAGSTIPSDNHVDPDLGTTNTRDAMGVVMISNHSEI